MNSLLQLYLHRIVIPIAAIMRIVFMDKTMHVNAIKDLLAILTLNVFHADRSLVLKLHVERTLFANKRNHMSNVCVHPAI